MADPIRFAGFNHKLNPAPGTESAVRPLYTHSNGREHISCWKLTPDEIAQVMRTGEIWASVACGAEMPWGKAAPPIYLSGSPLMAAWDPDTGHETTYCSDGSHTVNDARQFAILHHTVNDARQFAILQHGDQQYGDGKPYAFHLAKVVDVLKSFDAEWVFLAAGWLHDTIEDCWQEDPIEERRAIIRARYGEPIESIVWACTGQMFIDGVKQDRAARNAEQYAKIAEFPHAAPVKVADRIANMEACVAFRSPQGKMYLNEVISFDANVGIYAPPQMRARMFEAAKGILAYTGETHKITLATLEAAIAEFQPQAT